MSDKVKFIRKNGHVIPIHDSNGPRQKRSAPPPKQKQSPGSPKKFIASSAAAGATAGATFHVRNSIIGEAAERAITNNRSLKKFAKNLKPGDILVTGATPSAAGWWTFKDGLDMIQHKGIRNSLERAGKFVGIKKSTQITPALSNSLMGLGAGKKYHAAVYLGNGKVAHSYPEYGVFKTTLAEALHGSNVTAHRFTGASKAETLAAVNFAKTAVKKQVPYQSLAAASKSVWANLGIPMSKKVNPDFTPMVCHTLPIRAWSQRLFKAGENTFSGDFKFTKGLEAVARRDVTNYSSAWNYVGQASKGLKWGLAAGAIAAAGYYGYKALRGKKK